MSKFFLKEDVDEISKVLYKLYDQGQQSNLLSRTSTRRTQCVRSAKYAISKVIAKSNNKENRIRKNRSICGCPMCEFHTSAYELGDDNE